MTTPATVGGAAPLRADAGGMAVTAAQIALAMPVAVATIGLPLAMISATVLIVGKNPQAATAASRTALMMSVLVVPVVPQPLNMKAAINGSAKRLFRMGSSSVR
jgi:hypothetical protein